jgi:MtN3 and saliva related transmembrane protein
MTELIGWFAAAVLLATIARQVYTQWREGTARGLSRWPVYRSADRVAGLRRV